LGKGSKVLSQKQKGWAVAQLVEHLPSMCLSLGSISSNAHTHQKKKNDYKSPCVFSGVFCFMYTDEDESILIEAIVNCLLVS
jgi:hypothetical protein